MTSGPINLTLGWLGRHTPPGAGVDGRRAAVIDIAQDLLLRELHPAGGEHRREGLASQPHYNGTRSLRPRMAGNAPARRGRFGHRSDPATRRAQDLGRRARRLLRTCSWWPGHEPRPFDPEDWLRTQDTAEVDLDDIGALAVPTPSLDDLNATIHAHFGFLRELGKDEQQLALARAQDRPVVLRLLTELPGSRLANLGIY